MAPVIPQLEQALRDFDQAVQAVRDAPDDAARAVAASALWVQCFHELQPAVTAERRSAVRRLKMAGWKILEIGNLLGVSDTRVSAIIQGGRKPRS